MIKKRLIRLIETTLSKKQISAILTGVATILLIWHGKFPGDSAWLAYVAWLTYVAAVHHIDLKTKTLFPEQQRDTNGNSGNLYP